MEVGQVVEGEGMILKSSSKEDSKQRLEEME